ncbi:MAG: adenylate/guanylate cyclase domain-containing protein [Deltaproteobacteria bacterium]|nr:adenylate/guanylate cyclase domain-containing protein [Deltaproteobacteria bacterium]
MNIKELFKPSYLKLAVIISIVFTAAYLISPSFLELLELKTIDARFKNRPPIAAGKEVVIATIDEKSLNELGRWPWPRTTIAKLIDVLTSSDAVVIAFDIMFSEPDEHSELKALISFKEKYKGSGSIPQGFLEYINKVKTELDSDVQLSMAIKKSARVILGYFFHFGKVETHKQGWELSHNYQQVDVLKQGEENLINASAIESNIDVIAKGARGFGYYNIIPDNDGSVRWDPLVIRYKDKYYAPLSLQALKIYLGDPPLSLTLADYGVANIRLGETSIPVDESGRLFINYYGGRDIFPHYSITDIIKGRIEKEKLKGKIVLIGATAIGVYDMRVTPFEGTYPGIDIHATVIDNILNKRFIVRPQWFGLLDILILVSIPILLAIVFNRLDALYGTSVAVVLIIGYVYFSAYLFNKGLVLNIIYPVLVAITTYLSFILYKWTLEAREKRKIKGTFQYYVAAPVMDELMKHPEKLRLGGEEKELTVLFSDIRQFTTISEGLKPDILIKLLNEYLSVMSDVVFKYQGYLDKYIGDAIMAIYGAPLMQEDHIKKACLTAIEMMEKLNVMKQEWREKGLPSLNIGVGINTGNMVIGNIGSEQKYEYTAIGDNVNLASRLEGLNKLYGTNIIISERVQQEIKAELLCRELDIAQVKGKTKPKTIYELVARKGNAQLEEAVESFQKGIKYYRERRWEEAIKTFNAVIDLKPEDSPSRLYIQRSHQFITNPPPDDWQGIFIINH